MQLKNAYITLKDHKENFESRPKCRLINPSKSEIGKISKKILEKINLEIRSKTKLIQWTDSQQVIEWFKNLDNKQNSEFIKFDVESFYPSITESLLDKAILFGKKHTKISQEEIEIIKTASKSILYNDEKIWTKRDKNENNDSTFDITMGSYHGAEVCELVGLYILDGIKTIIPKKNIGLYRDDGLAVIKKQSGFKTEKIKQKLHKFAKSIGLNFEIEGPMAKTDFLDLSLDLSKNIYGPYRKDNNEIKYIHKDSNHPKSITRQIPTMIGKRLSNRSINKEEFEKISGKYNEALKKSGYKEQIKYEPVKQINPKKRKRKIILFNPPFCMSVKTNLARKFLNLIQKHFTKDHPLRKIFNKNSINLSYSCMPNVGQIINSHNRKILRKDPEPEKPCNCKKFKCPINSGKYSCRTKNVVYKAEVKSEIERKTYIGLTSMEFKQRFYKHRADFEHRKHEDSTKLSNYIWKLKDKNIKFEINWKILRKVKETQNGDKMCRLCTLESKLIMKNDDHPLNQRSEIMNKCRHKNKFLLKNWTKQEKPD